MVSLLERKLIVVTGKGGVGKSTVAGALGLAAARRGLRTIVVEMGAQHHLPELFAADRDGPGSSEHTGHTEHPHAGRDTRRGADRPGRRHGEEIELQKDLWSTSIDPDRALAEWLQTLTGRISARLLASSNTFKYFAAAAPGAKELVSMVKLRELCDGRRSTYDLVVLDAPATGHALAMLAAPRTFAAIVRSGPLAEQARNVRELLEDPRRTGYIGVANATELAVSETLHLEQELRRNLDRDLDTAIVNGTVSRRFTRAELASILTATLSEATEELRRKRFGAGAPLALSAARAANTASSSGRIQQNQLTRLRRHHVASGTATVVLSLPFVFTDRLTQSDLERMAQLLDK